MKRHNFGTVTLLVIVSATMLSSCAFNTLKHLPYEANIDPLVQETVLQDNYFRPAAYEDNYSELIRSHPIASQRTAVLPSSGNQKLLVIPVDFTDYRATALGYDPDESRTIIENAFFGLERTTQWESLSSYYHKSSYGQLTITGKVSDWFPSEESAAALAASGSKTVATERLLKSAVAWYKATYEDITDFDADGDGCIDAVFLVYAAPYIDNDSVFWAFTSFDTGLDGGVYIGNPIGNAYVWASFHFMNAYNRKGDPHTFIHEFGHILGLTDYYNTSALPSVLPPIAELDSPFERYQFTHGPTGKADMMDYSIGDHTSLSKMLLGWTRPYVVSGPGPLTIRPFVESGDVIVLSPDWNGNAFDEYIAIELYAPQGLNYVDSERAYGHASARLMGRFGIKVYHIDARASYHRTSGDGFLGYLNEITEEALPADILAAGAYYRKVAHTNTWGTTINDHLIYRLLENGETTSFLLGAMATNETMFYEGDDFGVTVFDDFTLNSGDRLPWNFEIAELNRYEATIVFS